MKPKISFPDFEKLDIRIGKITKVEAHPNADKLYVLTVDFGDEGTRTIVAGLKNYCETSHLENKLATFVINLEPRTLRGIESQGMILAAISEDKTIGCIITPDSKEIKEGNSVS